MNGSRIEEVQWNSQFMESDFFIHETWCLKCLRINGFNYMDQAFTDSNMDDKTKVENIFMNANNFMHYKHVLRILDKMQPSYNIILNFHQDLEISMNFCVDDEFVNLTVDYSSCPASNLSLMKAFLCEIILTVSSKLKAVHNKPILVFSHHQNNHIICELNTDVIIR
jgi:hypothetical protein